MLGRSTRPESSAEELVILLALASLLATYGLSGAPVRRLGETALRAVNPYGPATSVYVARDPVLDEESLYAFVDLRIGLVSELPRAAARLAWLLGADESHKRRTDGSTR